VEHHQRTCTASTAPVESPAEQLLGEGLRRDVQMRLTEHCRDLVVVTVNVDAEADPAAMADVGREEVPL
jgi:hypothetical protein